MRLDVIFPLISCALIRLKPGKRGARKLPVLTAAQIAPGFTPTTTPRSRTIMNRDISTGPLAPPFTLWHTLLMHLLALHCSFYSRAPLCSFVHSRTHSLTDSRARWKLKDQILGHQAVLNHSAPVLPLTASVSRLSCGQEAQDIGWQSHQQQQTN